MKLKVIRISSGEDSTSGVLFDITDPDNKKFLAYTLEDEKRSEKVMHETRIPAGEYKIILRTHGGTHPRYAKRFPDIHRGMLHVIDVPNFKYILIHCGNDDEDTSGCLLVGDTQKNNQVEENGFIGGSSKNYARIYPPIAAALEAGEEVTIKYVDYA
tara:strand:- start:1658 stop:2128 length:471 start_codon:yes stop_codon:yes gene_type:complete